MQYYLSTPYHQALGKLGQAINNNIKYFLKNLALWAASFEKKKTAFIENNFIIVGMVKVS